MTTAVTKTRVAAAARFISNADVAAKACRVAGLPFFVACALLEKESKGRNVYGHDAGGALAGFELPVNKGNFEVFRWLVIEQGQTANGVGPCQITYAGSRRKDGTRDGGYFRQMEERGLDAWDPYDNMLFGFGLLAGHYEAKGSWEAAGTAYNGASAYGKDLAARIKVWKDRLEV